MGLLGAVQASEALELMAEVRSFSEKFLNHGDVILNVGLRQRLSTTIQAARLGGYRT